MWPCAYQELLSGAPELLRHCAKSPVRPGGETGEMRVKFKLVNHQRYKSIECFCQVCKQVPVRKCQSVPERQCEPSQRQKCASVPHQRCDLVTRPCPAIPAQACLQLCENVFWCKVCSAPGSGGHRGGHNTWESAVSSYYNRAKHGYRG